LRRQDEVPVRDVPRKSPSPGVAPGGRPTKGMMMAGGRVAGQGMVSYHLKLTTIKKKVGISKVIKARGSKLTSALKTLCKLNISTWSFSFGFFSKKTNQLISYIKYED